MRKDIIDQIAYKMFESEYIDLGFDIERCKAHWENMPVFQTKYIKFAEIALPVQMSYEVMDAKMESLRLEKQGPFWEGVVWAEEQYSITGVR